MDLGLEVEDHVGSSVPNALKPTEGYCGKIRKKEVMPGYEMLISTSFRRLTLRSLIPAYVHIVKDWSCMLHT